MPFLAPQIPVLEIQFDDLIRTCHASVIIGEEQRAIIRQSYMLPLKKKKTFNRD